MNEDIWPEAAEPGTVPAEEIAARKAKEDTDNDDSGRSRPTAAAVLVDLALERYRFGATEDGEAFAVPLPGGHVVRMLRGGRISLRSELAAEYRRRTGKIAPQQALADAMRTLEGEAQEADPEAVHLRVAEADGAVWIDLGDSTERVIRVGGGTWTTAREDVPVLFKRTELSGAMPTPTPGGDIARLWTVANVSEADRPLVLAWLAAALLRPQIPHPILAIFGEQGSGKSSGSRTLVRLLDPGPVPLRKPPRDADGWVTAAAGSYVVGLDNLSTVPDWLSDSLCRAATGEGDVRRALYTDGGLSVFAFRRVILINGIDVGAMRGDLAERLVTVNLERIEEGTRRTETQLEDDWSTIYPEILGGLLDLVAGIAPSISSLRLGRSPRMADFAVVLAAVDQVLGTDGLSRYADQARTMAEDSLDSDPFIAAMRTELHGPFTGTAAELRTEVTPREDGWRPPRDWPKNARQVTSTLRRNAPQLRKAGWTVEDLGSRNKHKVTEWLIEPTRDCPESRPALPANPSSQVTGLQEAGKAGKGGEGSNPPIPAIPANRNAPTCTNGEAGKAGKEYEQSLVAQCPRHRTPMNDGICGRCEAGVPA